MRQRHSPTKCRSETGVSESSDRERPCVQVGRDKELGGLPAPLVLEFERARFGPPSLYYTRRLRRRYYLRRIPLLLGLAAILLIVTVDAEFTAGIRDQQERRITVVVNVMAGRALQVTIDSKERKSSDCGRASRNQLRITASDGGQYFRIYLGLPDSGCADRIRISRFRHQQQHHQY